MRDVKISCNLPNEELSRVYSTYIIIEADLFFRLFCENGIYIRVEVHKELAHGKRAARPFIFAIEI